MKSTHRRHHALHILEHRRTKRENGSDRILDRLKDVVADQCLEHVENVGNAVKEAVENGSHHF
jgi:hypothetical protein